MLAGEAFCVLQYRSTRFVPRCPLSSSWFFLGSRSSVGGEEDGALQKHKNTLSCVVPTEGNENKEGERIEGLFHDYCLYFGALEGSLNLCAAPQEPRFVSTQRCHGNSCRCSLHMKFEAHLFPSLFAVLLVSFFLFLFVVQTSIGKWKGIERSTNTAPSFTTEYLFTGETLVFDRGQRCWNGPARSLRVSLACGPEDILSTVAEPETCAYTAVLETPAACVSGFREALLAEAGGGRVPAVEGDNQARREEGLLYGGNGDVFGDEL